MDLLGFLIGGLIVFWIVQLNSRVATLEKRLGGSVPTPAHDAPTVATAIDAVPFQQQVEQKSALPAGAAPVPEPRASIPAAPVAPDPLLEWLKENALIKIGAFIFFLGAVWFVSYAISEGWISPFMRIALGVMLGIAVCVVGKIRKRTNGQQYLVLTTLGVGIVIASIYAGQFVFSLLLPPVAIALLVVAIGYAVYVSVETDSEWLAVLGAISAMIAPILANAPNPDARAFLAFLFVVSAIFLSVVLMKNWRSITVTLAAGTALFMLAIYTGGSLASSTLWYFSLAFTILFFSATTHSILRSRTVHALDITTLGFTAVTSLCWMHEIAPIDWPAAFFFGAIFAFAAAYFAMSGRDRGVVAVYSAIAALYVLVGTAFAFEGATLTMMYTLEIGLALVLLMALRLDNRAVTTALLLFTVPVGLSVIHMADARWETSVLHSGAYSVYTMLGMCILIATTALLRFRANRSSTTLRAVSSMSLIGTWFFLSMTTWLVSSVFFPEGGAALVITYLMMAFVSMVILFLTLDNRFPDEWLYGAVVGMSVAVFATVGSFVAPAWLTSIAHADAYGLYVLCALTTYIAVSLYTKYKGYEGNRSLMIGLARLYGGLALAYFSGIIWLVAHALFASDDVAVSVALFIYTIVGLGFYMLGRTSNHAPLRYVGFIFLGAVVARLFIVEVWNMEMLGRTITFLGVGLLFMVTALVEKPFTKSGEGSVIK
jgi:uncharacterized membrane protein